MWALNYVGYIKKGKRFKKHWFRMSCIPFMALLFVFYIFLDKVLNLSQPQFLPLQNCYNNTCIKDLSGSKG